MNRAARQVALAAALLAISCAYAQAEAPDPSEPDPRGPVTFAVFGTAGAPDERATAALLRAAGDSTARFVVHFELAEPSRARCGDAAIDHRRALLADSPKPVVPVLAASEWATCGAVNIDPMERLDRAGDMLFDNDASLGQRPMPWSRQSATPRFRRYRENVRWTSGRILFATLNLPDNNNGFRLGAGRNGEFEERLVADRAWLDRTFRIATERKLRAIAFFFDGAPRFDSPLRAPDGRSAERDGYYEIEGALREHAAAFKGAVLLVQGHGPRNAGQEGAVDRPLKDAAGRSLDNVRRIVVAHDGAEPRWLRIAVDPDVQAADVFRVGIERLFDDPSGELYGTPRLK